MFRGAQYFDIVAPLLQQALARIFHEAAPEFSFARIEPGYAWTLLRIRFAVQAITLYP
jgi:hypothetical protein